MPYDIPPAPAQVKRMRRTTRTVVLPRMAEQSYHTRGMKTTSDAIAQCGEGRGSGFLRPLPYRPGSMIATEDHTRRSNQVPGRQTAWYGGLEFRARPGFWLRRLLRFPFYFESTNPSIKIAVKRVSDPPPGEDWEGDSIVIEVVHADGGEQSVDFSLPDLEIGESRELTLEAVYSWYPGQTFIRLRTKPGEYRVLYSYQVRTEEQLWLWAIGPVVALLFGVGATLLGVFIQKWLG